MRRIPGTQGRGSVLKAPSAAEGGTPPPALSGEASAVAPYPPALSGEASTIANKPSERIRTKCGTQRRTAPIEEA